MSLCCKYIIYSAEFMVWAIAQIMYKLKCMYTFNYRATEHIGSGQFGLVQKGVWHSPHGSVMVAIKTLNEHTSEEEKVKFLQEAAIMGQFHHPNIVKLHGVVTVGEPVSILIYGYAQIHVCMYMYYV